MSLRLSTVNKNNFVSLKEVPRLSKVYGDGFTIEVYVKQHKSKFRPRRNKKGQQLAVKSSMSTKSKLCTRYQVQIQGRLNTKFCNATFKIEKNKYPQSITVKQFDFDDLRHIRNAETYMKTIKRMIKNDMKTMSETNRIRTRTSEEVTKQRNRWYGGFYGLY